MTDNVSPLAIGDLAAPKNSNDVLHCGSGVYDCAVVASIDPFVLISTSGDMRWSSTVRIDRFEAVGQADGRALENVLDRIGRDTAHGIPDGAVAILRGLAAKTFVPTI